MESKYTIVLQSPMGPKKGSLNLKSNEDKINGILECLGKNHRMSGSIETDGSLYLEGILESPLGEEPFVIKGVIEENVLTARFKRRQESYEILGLKTEN